MSTFTYTELTLIAHAVEAHAEAKDRQAETLTRELEGGATPEMRVANVSRCKRACAARQRATELHGLADRLYAFRRTLPDAPLDMHPNATENV